VIRAFDGAVNSAGTQHSGSYEAYFAHAPGLKVVVPATPADAKGLLKSAVRDNGPVVFLEHKALLSTRGDVPEGEHLVPLGSADLKREGRDVTIICYGIMVGKALAAADQLARRGVEVEVVDLRSLVPLDVKTIESSVRKTRRVVVSHEAVERGGLGAEIAATIVGLDPPAVELPVVRVASRNTPVPFSPVLQAAVLPTEDDLVTAVENLVAR
jgi:acetoin:2,6-dichlorophenolindophenol oxidoreductase subunit beta